jgi:hypothetical protein
MVDQMWDNLEQWIDEYVEIIPLEEKDTRINLKSALEERDKAKAEKKYSEKLSKSKYAKKW